jgi:hypothetical protein
MNATMIAVITASPAIAVAVDVDLAKPRRAVGSRASTGAARCAVTAGV